MSLPVINETISAPDPTAVSGSVRLWAQDGGGGIAYTNAGTPITLGGITRVSFDASGNLKADDGVTSLTLNPNSGSSSDAVATPTGTVWQYEVKYPGTRTPDVRYLAVPDSAGPLLVSAILQDEPGAILPGGAAAAVATKVSKSGDTMSGPLVVDADNGIRIPDVTESINIMSVTRAATDGVAITFRDPGAITGGANTTFLQVLDHVAGSQITGIKQDGGQFWTDGLSFLKGSAIHAQTAYWPQLRFTFLDQPNKRAPALVFSYVGAGGTTVTNLGDTITVDAGKETWVRLTDSNVIQAAVNVASGLTTLTTIGTIGPGGQPGISAVPSVGTGPVSFYRRVADVWRTDDALEVNGLLSVADTAAGVPGLAGITTTTAGVRWDATLGLVLITGSTDRWRVGASGNFVPATDAAYDLGATTARVSDAHVNRLILSGLTDNSAGSTVPESNTTARPGSVYGRSAGTLWLKESGTGSTGWKQVLTGSYTLTGDVGGTPDATAIGAAKVTNSMLATVAANSIKSNATGSTATPTDLALGASTVPARLASGNLVAATPAQILALMGMQAFASPAAVGSYSAPGGNTTTGAVTTNTEYAHPIMFTAVPGAASKLAINIASTVATSVLRVGVRNDAGLTYPYPGTLINEAAATYSGSASTGTVEQSITWTPLPNVLYWLSAVSQTAAANVTKTNAVPYSLLSTSAGLSSIAGGYTQSGITGALATFSTTLAPTANPIRIAVLF